MSLVTNTRWFDNSMNANKLRQSYLKGFLDISGGAIQLRSDNSMNFYSGESTTPKFSIGANGLTIIDDSNAAQVVDISSVIALKGLTTNIQSYINNSQNGTGSSNFDQVAASDVNTAGNVFIGKTLIVGGNASFQQNVGINGNLNVGGNVTVQGDAYVNKALIVGGNCTIDGTLTVLGDVSMNQFHLSGSTISAAGDVSMNNRLFVNLDSSMNGKLAVGLDASFGNNVEVSGQLKCASLIIGDGYGTSNAITFGQKFIVNNDVSLNGRLFVALDASMDSKLNVGQEANFGSTLHAVGAATLDATLAVTGAATLSSTLNAVGAATLGSTLDVTGAATLSSTLNASGDATLGAKLSVASDASLNGHVTVASDAAIGGKLSTVGDASFNAYMKVGGDASFGSNLTVDNRVTAYEMYVTETLVIGAGESAALTITQIGTDAVINSANGNIHLNPTSAAGASNIGIVHIKNGLTVDGSINFTGNFIRTDTNVKFTTQIDVSNQGTGPALIAEQTGINDVALFKYGGATALRIVQDGKVAIGKDVANSMLDVSGNVNADGSLTVSGNVTVTQHYSSAAGNITLTNGKLTTNTMEVTHLATFDASMYMVGAGNFDMTGTTGYFVQF